MKAVASPNIAFIKYWGKLASKNDEDRNLATNPSLSMTLKNAQTETVVTKIAESAHQIYINNEAASAPDVAKVSAHIARVLVELGSHEAQRFLVKSVNNFPQGTGIASSASAFAALTLAVAGEVLGVDQSQYMLKTDVARLSRLARRGSGSACRSLEGGFVKWDGMDAHALVSDWKLLDTILIFSENHKKVSSTEGHALAESSPLFAKRLAEIPQRLKQVELAISEKNLTTLGSVLELEALELHEIARSSQPSVVYLNSESQKFIDHLKENRSRDFYFTLDAGPNVHLISEKPITGLEELFAKAGLKQAPRIWLDGTGTGPRLST